MFTLKKVTKIKDKNLNDKQIKKLLELIYGVEYGKIVIYKQAGKISNIKQEKSFKI